MFAYNTDMFVVPLIARRVTVTTIFDFWMSHHGFDIFCIVVFFVVKLRGVTTFVFMGGFQVNMQLVGNSIIQGFLRSHNGKSSITHITIYYMVRLDKGLVHHYN